MPAAGMYRHTITIQKDVGTETNDDGEHLDDYQDLATVRARGGPIRGDELWKARQAQLDVTHVFGVRWSQALADLTGSLRIIFRDRLLHVRNRMCPDERRIEWILECSEAADVSLRSTSALAWDDSQILWSDAAIVWRA